MEAFGGMSNPGRSQEPDSRNISDNRQNDDVHMDDPGTKVCVGIPPEQRPVDLETRQHVPIWSQDDFTDDFTALPTLQTMSSCAIAIELWRRIISNPSNSTRHYIVEIESKEIEQYFKALPLPTAIGKMVVNDMARIRLELINAQYYFNGPKNAYEWVCERLGQKLEARYKRSKFDAKRVLGDYLYCRWLPDGEIDQAASALNMLTNPNFSTVDRFKIMCWFCLEDQITNTPIESLPSEFVDDALATEDGLIFYWLCYLKGDLDSIPRRAGQSLALSMIMSSDVCTWPAVLCFWLRLSDDERTSELAVIIRHQHFYQKELLSLTDEAQRSRLFSTIPVELIRNFFQQPNRERFALSTWNSVRDTVSYEQFERIVGIFNNYDWFDVDYKMSWVACIWFRCPDRLKKLAFQPSFVKVIEKIYANYFARDPSKEMKFFVAYLSDADTEFRKDYILNFKDHMIRFITHPSVMGQLIELCLPDASDVLAFKKTVLQSDRIKECLCGFLVEDDFEKITLFMNYYCYDFDSRMKLFSELFETSTTVYGMCRKYLEPGFLTQLLEQCLPEASDVLTFKKIVLQSDLIKQSLCNLLAKEDFTKITLFTDYYCNDFDSKIEFFRELFEVSITQIGVLDNYIDPQFLDRIIERCMPEGADVAKFKTIVLGNSLIKQSLCKLLGNENFQKVRAFVNYYCHDFASTVSLFSDLFQKSTAENEVYDRYIDPDFMDQLFEQCLPEGADVVSLKQIVLHSPPVRKRLCEDLVVGSFRRITRFARYYCTDSVARIEFVSQLFDESITRHELCFIKPISMKDVVEMCSSEAADVATFGENILLRFSQCKPPQKS